MVVLVHPQVQRSIRFAATGLKTEHVRRELFPLRGVNHAQAHIAELGDACHAMMSSEVLVRFWVQPLDKKGQVVDDFVIVDEQDFLRRNLEAVSVGAQRMRCAPGKSIHASSP